MSFSNRAFARTRVLLESRSIAVPGALEMSRLSSAGRIKDISFTKNTTAPQLGTILVSCFPVLAGKDLTRLQFIASYSRGHAMSCVATGLQTGAKVVELFGGSRRKKVTFRGNYNVDASSILHRTIEDSRSDQLVTANENEEAPVPVDQGTHIHGNDTAVEQGPADKQNGNERGEETESKRKRKQKDQRSQRERRERKRMKKAEEEE